MPEFGNPFSGNDCCRKLTKEELIRAIRFSITAEYEAVQFYIQIADATDDQLVINVMEHIAEGEIIHAGEFLRLLEELSPEEAVLYAEGAKKVEAEMKKLVTDQENDDDSPLFILD